MDEAERLLQELVRTGCTPTIKAGVMTSEGAVYVATWTDDELPCMAVGTNLLECLRRVQHLYDEASPVEVIRIPDQH